MEPSSSPPVPAGSGSMTAATDAHVALYRDAHPDWAEKVSVHAFFREKPDLAAYGPAEAVSAPATRRQWPISVALILLAIGLVAAGNWRLKQLFASSAPERSVTLTDELRTLPTRKAPTVCRAHVNEINAAIERRDWLGTIEAGERFAGDAALMRAMEGEPDAARWLAETLIVAPVLAAENATGAPQRQLYLRARTNHQRFGAAVAGEFRVRYARIVAEFFLLGGTNLPENPDAAARRTAEELIQQIAELRNRNGALLAGEEKLARRLLLIEGWCLAWRLSESPWLGLGRFDAASRDQQDRWRRLEQLITEARTKLGLANDRDLLSLELFFWRAADSFTHLPFDEEVRIGNWSAKESEIEQRIARLQQQLRPAP
jgi:hypothetical protein